MSKSRGEIIKDIKQLATDESRPMSERLVDLEMIEEETANIQGEADHEEEEEETCEDCGEELEYCVCGDEEDDSWMEDDDDDEEE